MLLLLLLRGLVVPFTCFHSVFSHATLTINHWLSTCAGSHDPLLQ